MVQRNTRCLHDFRQLVFREHGPLKTYPRHSMSGIVQCRSKQTLEKKRPQLAKREGIALK